ncbi:MAG: DUF885 domain-containing protein [Clostridiales bacterium]|nr:DUF885 domain-containing protein [Clostridiales bacterium]
MKKRVKILLTLCIFAFFIIASSGCNKSTSIEEQSKFNDFIYDVFVEEATSDTLSLNYILAHPENYGIENTEITLGEYSLGQMKEDLKSLENYLKELKSFNYNMLTENQQLTYDIMKYSFEQDLRLADYLYYLEILGPTTGLQAQLPILLAEYNFYDKDDIETYLKLLPHVYDYFEDIVEFEKEKSQEGLFMSDAVADRIIEQCNTFIEKPEENFLIEYFNDKIDLYDGLTEQERENYKKDNREKILDYVIPSYELLIDSLEELKGTGTSDSGLYLYPKGREYYECITKIKTGSGKNMTEIIDMLESAFGDSFIEITKLTLNNPLIIEEVGEFSAFPLTDPDEILENLRTEILETFPEPAKVNCDIKYVHESLSEYLSPAFYLIPALDNYNDNNIYINGKDVETLSYIYTTVAHEGYPGHLYQITYFKNQEPDLIRNLLNFDGYDEGWATYVELYSYHLSGIDSELAALLEYNNEIMLIIYARTDIGIHYEGWTKEKAISYLNQLFYDQAVSEEIYETLLEEPAIYLPYAVGYLEIKNLRNKAESVLGETFDLKEFHQFILDIGPAPFEIIEDRMDTWLKHKSKDYVNK